MKIKYKYWRDVEMPNFHICNYLIEEEGDLEKVKSCISGYLPETLTSLDACYDSLTRLRDSTKGSRKELFEKSMRKLEKECPLFFQVINLQVERKRKSIFKVKDKVRREIQISDLSVYVKEEN